MFLKILSFCLSCTLLVVVVRKMREENRTYTTRQKNEARAMLEKLPSVYKNIVDTYTPEVMVFAHLKTIPNKEFLHTDISGESPSVCIYIRNNEITFQDLLQPKLHLTLPLSDFDEFLLWNPKKSRPQFSITLFRKMPNYQKTQQFWFYTAPFIPERDQNFSDFLNPKPFVDYLKEHLKQM